MLSEPMELGFILLAFVLGVANLSFSWWRTHHRPECLLLFAVGMALILVRDHIAGTVMSAGVSVCGGVLIGLAHLRNIRLVRKCGCAGTVVLPCKDPASPHLRPDQNTSRNSTCSARGVTKCVPLKVERKL